MLLLAVTVTLAGCARPGDHPVNPNCVWTEEDSHPLNLENAADRRHLRYDAITAEDVAIRWADKYVGLAPGYGYRRDECMEVLFNGVASHHSVDVALVRQYRLERDIVVDSAVVLGFGVLYAAAAYGFASLIRRRFPPDEWLGFWIMTLVMSVGVSLVGVLVGDLWSRIIETLRMNSDHISYRIDRIPWRSHWPALFVCGLAVFWLAALIRSRVGIRHNGNRWFRGGAG